MYTLNISVIVTSYNRKNFVKNAIKSVIRQDVDSSRCELIIVSNYNIELNQFPTNMPISIIVMEGTVGEFILAGIKRAKYDLIAFLDDDDEFELSKIESVLPFFENDNKLVFYHNSLNYIDDSGNPKNYSRMVESRFQKLSSNTIIFSSSNGIEKLDLALKQNADFNLSCIVIRKNNFKAYEELLKDIEGSTDGFFFWTSVISGGNIIVSTEKLTRYRVHCFNVTKSNSFEGKVTEIGKQIKTFSLILDINESENSDVNKILIKKWIEMMKLEYEMIQMIFSHNRRGELLKKAKILCGYDRRFTNALKYRLLFFSCVYLIFPSIAFFIYKKLSR